MSYNHPICCFYVGTLAVPIEENSLKKNNRGMIWIGNNQNKDLFLTIFFKTGAALFNIHNKQVYDLEDPNCANLIALKSFFPKCDYFVKYAINIMEAKRLFTSLFEKEIYKIYPPIGKKYSISDFWIGTSYVNENKTCDMNHLKDYPFNRMLAINAKRICSNNGLIKYKSLLLRKQTSFINLCNNQIVYLKEINEVVCLSTINDTKENVKIKTILNDFKDSAQ